MKVERKGKKVFEPIIITLETEEEVQWLWAIARIKKAETLKECCKRIDQNIDAVDAFGLELSDEFYDLLDC